MNDTVGLNETTLSSSGMLTRAGLMRIGIGLAQGCILYLLYFSRSEKAWPATEASLFSGLLLLFLFVPILAIASIGTLRGATLVRWLIVAALLAVGLGYYDSWRNIGVNLSDFGDPSLTPYPSFIVWFFCAAGFFISQSLVLASSRDGAWIARYGNYFEASWKLIVQLKFSLLFVGVFWLLLWLGATLFNIIGLRFFKELIEKAWFVVPATTFAFTSGMHLTDVRPSIVSGIRNLLLTLLSWLLPVAVLIIGGFLLSLPFTGLKLLWATKAATATLLIACAALVIFVNAAFQNGLVAAGTARLLRICAKLACVLMVPLVLLAVYALYLRVAEYGWSTNRIISACCILVAAIYALGYLFAAVDRKGWLNAIARVNVACAFVVLAILLALFTPLMDPARVSVENQLALLRSGKISATQFDFNFLRFEGKRFGDAALRRLEKQTEGKEAELVRANASAALSKTQRYGEREESANTADLVKNLKAWPSGALVPVSFLGQDWSKFDLRGNLPHCLLNKNSQCDVYSVDFDGDGKTELLLIDLLKQGYLRHVIFEEKPEGRWAILGTLPNASANCPGFAEKMRTGNYRLTSPRLKAIEIGGRTLEVQPFDIKPCDPLETSK
jgi:Domain of unknown function (DUF4153)